MHQLYGRTGVVLEIDPIANEIVRGDVAFITEVARDFMRNMLQSYDLNQGIEPLCEEILTRYYAPSAQSFVMALRVAYQRYSDMRAKLNKPQLGA